MLGDIDCIDILWRFGISVYSFPMIDLVDGVNRYSLPEFRISGDRVYFGGKLAVSCSVPIENANLTCIVPLEGYKFYQIYVSFSKRVESVWILCSYPDNKFCGSLSSSNRDDVKICTSPVLARFVLNGWLKEFE